MARKDLPTLTVSVHDSSRTMEYLSLGCPRCKAIDGGALGQIAGMVLVGKRNGQRSPLFFADTAPVDTAERQDWGGAHFSPRMFDKDGNDATVDLTSIVGEVNEIQVHCHGRKHPYVVPRTWLLRESWSAVLGGYPSITLPEKFIRTG